MATNHWYVLSVIILVPHVLHATEHKNVSTKNQDIPKTGSKDVTAMSRTSTFVDLTHSGREHVSEKIISQHIPVGNTNTAKLTESEDNRNGRPLNLTYHNADILKNINDNKTDLMVKKNSLKNNSISVKNSSLPISAVTLKPTTVKPVPKKPLKTVRDDEADNPNFVPKKVNTPVVNVMNIDPILSEKNHQRSNYVVPIVGIIFSVPLVAIVISVLYKRGKDWWLHRNYRRMDYLIEGLYNS